MFKFTFYDEFMLVEGGDWGANKTAGEEIISATKTERSYNITGNCFSWQVAFEFSKPLTVNEVMVMIGYCQRYGYKFA